MILRVPVLIWSILILSAFMPVCAEITNADTVPGLKVLMSGDPTDEYIFTTLASTDLAIYDNYGTAIFRREIKGRVHDLNLQPNGYLSYFSVEKEQYYFMDSAYRIIDSVRVQNGFVGDLHELRLSDEGHYFILGTEIRTVDMSALVEGGDPEASVVGYVVQELDVSGTMIHQEGRRGTAGRIFTGRFSPGIYFIQFIFPEGNIQSSKFLIR